LDFIKCYAKILQKLKVHNFSVRPLLPFEDFTSILKFKFGSEAWVLKKREDQRLETAKMKFLRHLLGITKLDKEKNQCIRQKTGA